MWNFFRLGSCDDWREWTSKKGLPLRNMQSYPIPVLCLRNKGVRGKEPAMPDTPPPTRVRKEANTGPCTRPVRLLVRADYKGTAGGAVEKSDETVMFLLVGRRPLPCRQILYSSSGYTGIETIRFSAPGDHGARCDDASRGDLHSTDDRRGRSDPAAIANPNGQPD